MKVLNWNCRGIGYPLIVRTARLLTQSQKPTLLFIIETKMKAEKLKFLGLSLGFKFWTGIDSEGQSEGLWAAWDDSQEVKVLY